MRGLFVMVVLAVLLRGAHAAPHVIEPRPERGAIDWTRGLITAMGAAAADLRAPSPDVARVTAERRAMDQARARLRESALSLTVGGVAVAERARDADVAARLARALERALTLDVAYGSDGSAVVTAALPLEQVRHAVLGVPRARAAADAPTAIIIDARKHLRRPVLGLTVAAGDAQGRGPAVFHRSLDAAARDVRLGERVVRARARALAGGADGPRLELEARDQDVATALETGALLVIVIAKEP